MPEPGESNISGDVSTVVESIKQDVSWAEGKQIDTYEQKVGVHEHIFQNKLDPYSLLESLEQAKDAWDENGNLVKIADYRHLQNGDGENATEVIFQIRQVTFQKELEKAYRAVEKAEQKNGHLVTLAKGQTLTLGSDPEKGTPVVEEREPQVLSPNALELTFDDAGRVSFKSLSGENQVTVSYKSKTDGGLHFIPLPKEVNGSLTPQQTAEFNRDALPGNTKIFVYDERGHGLVFSEYNVVLGKNLSEFLTGKGSNIKEIRWRWQEVKPNTPEINIEDIVIHGEQPPAGADESIFLERAEAPKAETLPVAPGKYYKVGTALDGSLPYENAFGFKFSNDGSFSLMSGQEGVFALVYYKLFGRDRWEPAFSLENRQSPPARIESFRKAQTKMNGLGDLRTLRIEIGKNGEPPSHQAIFSDFPESYGPDSKNLGEVTLKIEKVKL